jgi:uncharacterized protein
MSTSARYAREYPQRYRLEAGQCTKCGKVHFPPRLVCDACGAKTFEKTVLPDIGKLVTYTVIRTPPSDFVDQAPYAVGLIELENGVRLMAQITDCAPEEMAVGKAVKLEFRRISAEGEAGIINYGYKGVLAENTLV